MCNLNHLTLGTTPNCALLAKSQLERNLDILENILELIWIWILYDADRSLSGTPKT